MKPLKFLKMRAVALSCTLLTGILLAGGSFGLEAQAPARSPLLPLPNVTRGPGGLISPALPCGQNRLSVAEQIQNGTTLAEIQQQETVAVACKVNPAVVEVIAYGFGAVPGQEYDTPASATPGPSIGSGAIVSADGFIVTNRHVIKNAPKLTVVLHTNGKPDEQITASLVGQDDSTDIAVLKIEKSGLPFLDFNLQPVRQGATVFAFGSPHGVGISMTKGIISAPTRQVKEEDQVDYIQTDAAINPGNSGGALVDINGRLVGINTFILSGSGGNEGLNFALPADVVSYVYNQIRTNGFVIRGTIGITARNLTPELVRALKLPVQVGVYIEDVEPKGPADTAGIQVGDIVVAIDKIAVQISEAQPDPALELRRAITRRIRGATIRLDVLRGTETKTFSVNVIQSSPDQFTDFPQLTSDYLIDSLGIYGLKMTLNSAAMHNLRSHQGVLVAAKVQTMQAYASDLQVDDLITQIGGQPVAELEDIRKTMESAASGSTVALQVERNRKMMLILVKIN